MIDRLNLAVIGAGYWGKNLIRNFFELGALKFICDQNSELKKGYQEKYPDVVFLKNFNEVLSTKEVDAIVIATPAESHYILARQGLMAGKHVFVEKPLALELEHGERLISIAKESKKVLMVGHILQYHPAVLKLKQLIDEGELGKIQYIYSNRLSIGKIRTEENILWSFAPHDISVILLLLKELPISVQVSGGEYLQSKIADVTMTTMEFQSAVKGHIFVSWLHPFKEQKLIVIGDQKMAVFDDVSEEKLFLYPHKIEWKKRIPVANKAKPEIVHVEKQEPLKAECQHFLDCVRENKRPNTDGKEGADVLRVLKACQYSLNNNGKRVFLDNIENKERPLPPLRKIKIHPTAEIDEGCSIGDETQVWHFSHVMRGSKIGYGCRIGQNVVIGPNANIGNGCKIQNNVCIYEGVTLEDEVFCGPSMVFTNVFNPRAAIPRMNEVRKTVVKKGATIGANATIICGNTIGNYAFIGAGAVVTKEVPDYALVVGNPGKIAGWMCPCGIKITFNGDNGECPECKLRFKKHGAYIERED